MVLLSTKVGFCRIKISEKGYQMAIIRLESPRVLSTVKLSYKLYNNIVCTFLFY